MWVAHAVQEQEITVLARIKFKAWDPPFDRLMTLGHKECAITILGARNRMVARVLKSMVGMVVPDMPGVNNRIPRQLFHLF